ncbi:dihydrofolate reductase family protein [Actinocorallia libanotica]
MELGAAGGLQAQLQHGEVARAVTAHPRQEVAHQVRGQRPVRRLKKEDGLDIWLCGGGRLAGSLLPEIDELIVKSYPVVAGDGIPLFSAEFHPTRFTPSRRRSFENGVLVTWYSRP